MEIPPLSYLEFLYCSQFLVIDRIGLLSAWDDSAELSKLINVIDPKTENDRKYYPSGAWATCVYQIYKQHKKIDILEKGFNFVYDVIGEESGLRYYLISELKQQQSSVENTTEAQTELHKLRLYRLITQTLGIKTSREGKEITIYNMFDLLTYKEIFLWGRLGGSLQVEDMQLNTGIMTDGEGLHKVVKAAERSAFDSLGFSGGYIFEKDFMNRVGKPPSITVEEYWDMIKTRKTFTGSILAMTYRARLREKGICVDD